MAEFAEIDLDKRLAVVGARARPSMSLHQSAGSLRGNFEPLSQFGIRQHLDGHDIRSRFSRTVTTRTRQLCTNLWLRAGLSCAGTLARRAGVGFGGLGARQSTL